MFGRRRGRDIEAENLLRQAKSAIDECNAWMSRAVPQLTDKDDPTVAYSKYISVRIDRFLREGEDNKS